MEKPPAVTANNVLSSSFPWRKGIRQGCNLSPLLFSLYISDLESYLAMNSARNVMLANLKAQLLLFADNLFLFHFIHILSFIPISTTVTCRIVLWLIQQAISSIKIAQSGTYECWCHNILGPPWEWGLQDHWNINILGSPLWVLGPLWTCAMAQRQNFAKCME